MYSLLKPLLFKLPAEISHDLTLKSAGLLNSARILPLFMPGRISDPVEVLGIKFPNRVGLAAGLDKNADYVGALSAMGFGFVEAGTITPKPQPGNDKPRMFRLSGSRAIINRMGFNNLGIGHLLAKIKNLRAKGYKGVIGINIGKNVFTPVEQALDDYRYCLNSAYPHADYVTINISSPNTPGLRDLQYGAQLRDLLHALKQQQKTLETEYGRYVPLLVKVAPDLDAEQISGIAECLVETGMDGLIATNTTLSRADIDGELHKDEAGGLSGQPLTDLSTNAIRQFAEEFKRLGVELPIIGVGGILSAQDALDKIDAGATLVQLYSGLIYRGPTLVKECADAIKQGRS